MDFTRSFIRAKSPCAKGAGGSLECAQAIRVAGLLPAKGSIRAGLGIERGQTIDCGSHLDAAPGITA